MLNIIDYYPNSTSDDINAFAAWLEAARYTDLLTFFLATMINGILLNLIKTESPKHFGNYTYLMTSFAVNSLLFASIHAFIQPIISIEKYVVFVFTSTNYLEVPRSVMSLLLAIYGTSYSQTLVFIAVQFIYRFFSIAKKSYIYYFKGNWLIGWYVVVCTFGLNWGLCILIIARQTQQVDDILRPVMADSYNLDMNRVYYVAASYEIEGADGSIELNWKCIFMVLNFALILSISLTVIIVCLLMIARKMKQLKPSRTITKYQKQLFTALVCQMIIPLFLIYLPVIGVLILPFFNIKNNAAISVTSIMISLYPVLDPIAAILIISVYREGLLKMFVSRPTKTRVQNIRLSAITT